MFGPNLMLGAPDRALAGTFSGGSYRAGYGASAMGSAEVTSVARTTDLTLASTQVIVDLGAAYTFQAIAEINHNLPQAAQRALSFGTTSGGSEVGSVAMEDVWAITWSETGVEWLAPDWWGGGLDTGIYGCPYIAPKILPAPVTARYVKVEWDVRTSAEAYLMVGRLVICPVFQPRRGAVYGIDHGRIDGSTKTKLKAGGFAAEEARAPSRVSFSLPIIGTGAEEYRLRDILRRQRTVRDVLYISNPADPVRMQMTSFLGTIDELRGARRISHDANSIDLSITERM